MNDSFNDEFTQRLRQEELAHFQPADTDIVLPQSPFTGRRLFVVGLILIIGTIATVFLFYRQVTGPEESIASQIPAERIYQLSNTKIGLIKVPAMLFAGPNTQFHKINALPAGEKVKIIAALHYESGEKWLMVELPGSGVSGWIQESLIDY
jgi:hypothetical protein